QTAALRGLRPVAKALGWAVGEMYRRGMGWLALADSSRTMAYSWGDCASVIGCARIERNASLSEKKYVPKVMASDTRTAITRPALPPNQYPTSRINAVRRPSRAAVFRPLRCECTSNHSLWDGSNSSVRPSSLALPTSAWGVAERILCKEREVGCADG